MPLPEIVGTAYLFLGVLTGLLGLVIFRENTGSRLNRLTALMLLFTGMGAILGAGGLYRTANLRPDANAASGPLITTSSYLWEFFFPALLLFAASFPKEERWARRNSWGEFAVFLPHTIHFILMFSAGAWGTSFGLDRVSGHVGIFAGLADLTRVLLRQFFTWHRYLFSLVNLAYVGIAMFLIARNHVEVRNIGMKSLLRVILVGMGLGALLYSLGAPLDVLLGLDLPPHVASTLQVMALACWGATIAYAIVRHRFLDARWIVRRTILYAVASAGIVGLYLQVARRLGASLAGMLAVPPGVLEWVALVVPLMVFQPVMARVEESLDAWLMRGRQELRSVMNRMSARLSSTLDFEGVAREMATELPSAIMCSGAAFIVVDGHSGFRVLANRGMPEADLALAVSVAPHLPDPPEDGRPLTSREWIETCNRAGLDRREVASRLRAGGIHLSYELRHAGERLGFLLLGRKLSGMRFSGEEVALLGNLTSQCSSALKNGILYRDNLGKAMLEEELALARKIQQAFIPSSFPTNLPVDVHGINVPSKQVGGDYFDFFPVHGGGYALAIADVAGKGVGAALLASMLQASLRTLLKDGAPPGRVMERVNTLLCESTSAEQFATLFVAHYDPHAETLTYCNAGHNYPLHRRADGSSVALERSALVLGVCDGIAYPEDVLRLAPGDLLLLYTDGVTEARSPDGEEFGEDRLTKFLIDSGACASRDLVHLVREEVLNFVGGPDTQDDMTLLCMRVPERVVGGQEVSAELLAEILEGDPPLSPSVSFRPS